MPDFSISMLLVIPVAIVMLMQFTCLFKIMPFTGTKTKTNHKHE